MSVSAIAGRTISILGLVAATGLGMALTATADPDMCSPVDGAPNSCTGQPPQTWPLAQGNFTSPGNPGWIYFKPFFGPAGFTGPKADAMRAAQYGCGIGPDGFVGCDHVPPLESPGQPGPPGSYSCGGRRCPLPPPGSNQTVVSATQPADYVTSDAATFTRNVDELPQGYRLANGGAWCAVGYQGSLTCVSGANGFTIGWSGGVLEAPANS